MQTRILEEREPWTGPLALSAGLHFLAAVVIVLVGYWAGPARNNWGGDISGDAISANLVGGVPLPRPQQPTENILANDSKGITQSTPAKPQEQPDAIPIPEKPARQKAGTTPRTPAPSMEKPLPTPPPQNNVVPFGEGGPVSGPYGSFSATKTKGGFNFQNGGNFGSQFAYYVDVVRRKVSENWFKYEVDPNVSTLKRVYIVFDILRDGSPANVRVEQSSGVPSLDDSAKHAIQRIDTFGPLPSGYNGGKVSVEFWFDYQR